MPNFSQSEIVIAAINLVDTLGRRLFRDHELWFDPDWRPDPDLKAEYEIARFTLLQGIQRWPIEEEWASKLSGGPQMYLFYGEPNVEETLPTGAVREMKDLQTCFLVVSTHRERLIDHFSNVSMIAVESEEPKE